MDDAPTIIATLVNDDGSVHRVLEIPASQFQIREPVTRSVERQVGKQEMTMHFKIQCWEPVVVVEFILQSGHPSKRGRPQLVGFYLRVPLS